jgi:hypothetical protein
MYLAALRHFDPRLAFIRESNDGNLGANENPVPRSVATSGVSRLVPGAIASPRRTLVSTSPLVITQ